MTDLDADLEVIDLRAALRVLQPALTKACLAYGARRGMSLYREHHLRNALKEEAA
jgi:hypothetical protein